ncbi:MAG TPA: hypothetical protein DD379_23040 [Cyanobacteria bacterium UBA11162]|nr:hypothetical protein [Cyanobacteria bacterium UBA11162]
MILKSWVSFNCKDIIHGVYLLPIEYQYPQGIKFSQNADQVCCFGLGLMRRKLRRSQTGYGVQAPGM